MSDSLQRCKQKRVLCPWCEKPVLETELGAITKTKDGPGCWHQDCVTEASETFACFTGDCDHWKQTECDEAIKELKLPNDRWPNDLTDRSCSDEHDQ